MGERILFLTGKLAEPRLRRVLEAMAPLEFAFDIRNLGLNVAALMTAGMIERRLGALDDVDRIIVPGLCRGDLDALSERLAKPVVRGCDDLKDLPAFFGREGRRVDLSRHDVQIFAEIVEASRLDVAVIIDRATELRAAGADVIDLGCLPDTPFPHLEDAILSLKAAGFAVSVDTLDDEELLRAGRAGADYLLSLTEESLWIADEVESTPVIISTRQEDLPSLYRSIETVQRSGRPFLADSILDPVHFGFARSLWRYMELRRSFPDIDIIMGTGNITELTEADTTGMHALLFGLISELRINAVLTTQVSPHARSVVREADRARRIMYAARADERLPKGLDSGLLALHERKPFPYDSQEIAELAAEIRDPSYRIQVSESGIHVFNRDGLLLDTDPFRLFSQLDDLQQDAPHAFYMGVELQKARLAWQLGKRYVQDEELQWGVAVTEDAGRRARGTAAIKAQPETAGLTPVAKGRRRRKAGKS